MTEHATDEGKLYLAAVIDAFSRMFVGWSMDDHPVAGLAVDGVNMAVWNRRPEPGLVDHLVSGAQYCRRFLSHTQEGGHSRFHGYSR